MAAISLSGLGGINIFGTSVLNALGILAVMLLSFKAGPGVGAAVGVIVGLVINLSGPATPLVIGSYAFCGLMPVCSEISAKWEQLWVLYLPMQC